MINGTMPHWCIRTKRSYRQSLGRLLGATVKTWIEAPDTALGITQHGDDIRGKIGEVRPAS